MSFLKSKKVIILLVLIGIGLFVAISLASGAMTFKVTTTRAPSTPTETGLTPEKQPEAKKPFAKILESQKPVLAERASTFKDMGANSGLEFSIKLPIGWATAEDESLDFVAGSLTPEKLSDGRTFTANLNAVVGTHPAGYTSFADYQQKWKPETMAQYPSMEPVSDYSTKISGMDVYVIEVTNSNPSGLLLRQAQYVFYVTDTHALVVTITAPQSAWASYDEVLKKSVESVKVISQ